MLHINGNVAGLDQEVPHPGFGVLHHQLAGFVVVFVGFIPGSGQQAIGFIAQAAFGQGDVQPLALGALLLYRRQGSAQALQLVQVKGKAQGAGTGGKALGQQVIPAAFQHGTGHPGHITAEHQAVVIFHITGKAQIQLHAASGIAQFILQALQFQQGVLLGFALALAAGGGQCGAKGAVQA